ncbi:MAG: hypothetical protein ACJ8C4_17610 [Gemmataceae bacterium]
MTPTARTLELLRRSGYTAAVVESWLPRVNRRRDLFGFADVIAVTGHRKPSFLLVQVTVIGHITNRLTKAKSKPALRTWLAAGGAFEVWGWVGRGGRWQVKRVRVESADLTTTVIEGPTRRRPSTQPDLFTTPANSGGSLCASFTNSAHARGNHENDE